MLKRRATYVLSMDLDGVPGTNHIPEEMAEYLDKEFKARMGHYNPSLVLVKVEEVNSIAPHKFIKSDVLRWCESCKRRIDDPLANHFKYTPDGKSYV